MALHSITNRICGMMSMLGFPCLIIGIILIARNKSKASRNRGIFLICLLPASIIIRFTSSIIFYRLTTTEYDNYSFQGDTVPGNGRQVNPNQN